MRILLDTCAFLWLAANSPRVTSNVRSAFEDKSNLIYLSVSSAWEISIKHNLGQLDLPDTPEKFVPERMVNYQLNLVEVTLAHAIRAGGLPLHHKDPFDRMIIAQAQIEGLVIATPDQAFAAYDVERLW